MSQHTQRQIHRNESDGVATLKFCFSLGAAEGLYNEIFRCAQYNIYG